MYALTVKTIIAIALISQAQCFSYCIPPPSVSNEHNSPVILKAWGDTASENEIYTLDSLEDFLQTDLAHIVDQRTKILSEFDVFGAVIFNKDTMLQRHDIAAYTPEGGPRKKRRLDTQSLCRQYPSGMFSTRTYLNHLPCRFLFCKPHIHPSPYIPTDAPLVGRSFEPILPTSNSMSEDMRVA